MRKEIYMILSNFTKRRNDFLTELALLFLFFAIFSVSQISAQTLSSPIIADSGNFPEIKDSKDKYGPLFSIEKDFRIEKMQVSGGAEIITLFANLKGLTDSAEEKAEEVPLISILRDTLGDEKIENDRLRFVWSLSYAKPSMRQRFSAAVPFLYSGKRNKKEVKDGMPPVLMDLEPVNKDFWDKAFWTVFRSLIIEDFSIPVRAAALQYRANSENYQKSQIARVLAVLSLYEAVEDKKILNITDLKDIQARLMLSDKLFGSFMQNENLHRVYKTENKQITGNRGQNWELLRQYAEAQDLYFEPLEMPDRSATHALVWIAKEDLERNKNKSFNGRFLNIKNPWNDKRLKDWKGYEEIRWFDENNRQVEDDAPNAKPKTLIPLALYGLDFPKIPTILVDFRDQNNPKKREMSRRVLNDLAYNVLSISRISNLPFFVGNFIYDFVMKRRGIDINQKSRVNSYAQLKFLLSLNASLDPTFRDEIAGRLETVSINPLENNLNAENRIAKRQYQNLMEYAKNPNGLPKKLEKLRGEEMTRLKHTKRQRFLYNLARVVTFGVYKHRENYTPELRYAMDLQRQLEYHERFLREVARNSVRPEIDNDLPAIKKSLEFISRHGERAKPKTVEAIARIFSISEIEDIRHLCLSGLHKIENSQSKKELRAVYKNEKNDWRWRNTAAVYLNIPANNKNTGVDSLQDLND